MYAALLVLALQAPDLAPGEHAVAVDTAHVHELPSRTSKVIRSARREEKLNVVSVEHGWANVDLGGGRAGFIRSTMFSDRRLHFGCERTVRELEGGVIEIQIGCFGAPLDELVFREVDLGLSKAYAQVSRLQVRSGAHAPGLLEDRLREFRREGKLGEFAPNR